MNSQLTISADTDNQFSLVPILSDIDELKSNKDKDLSYVIINDINGKGFSGVYTKLEDDRLSTSVDKVMVIDSLSNRWRYSVNLGLLDNVLKLASERQITTMPNLISPELFDAVGDGIADDTDAIIRTFNYVNFNDRVLTPIILLGQYRVSRDITLTTSTYIQGYNEAISKSKDKLSTENIDPLTLSGFLVEEGCQLVINNPIEDLEISIKLANILVKSYGCAFDTSSREKPFVKDISIGGSEVNLEDIHLYGFQHFF